jgi:REP element-mobilizing transposase RayT
MRPLRVNYAGAVQHVGNRGSNHQAIFLDDEDRRLFLTILGSVLGKYGASAISYCLMDNHYHLLLHTPTATLDRIMQELGSQYTRAFNRRHGRDGPLCRGRYWSKAVRSEKYFAAAARYVDANPVGHGAVKDPAEWVWSSFRANAGQALAPPWLRSERLLASFGGSGKRYRDFVLRTLNVLTDENAETFALAALS